MASNLIRVERADRIATVSFDNPPVNAASIRLFEEFDSALADLEKDSAIRCLILTGAGEKAFCAGADLREESQFRDPTASKAFRDLGRRTLHRIEECAKPIVAAIHGYCIGGGTALAWACDIRIAADNTVFRAGDAYLGLIPSWGMGLQRLPRYVGRNKALDILLIGQNFGAAEALDLGLLTKVVPKATLKEETEKVANRIAEASPTAILATRKAISYNLRHGWDEMAAYEEKLCEEVFAHPDAHEGMNAFFEKRPTVFKDL